jgi:hypothetical protein
LLLKLVDETKFELHVQSLCNIFINKVKKERYRVSTRVAVTIRIVTNTPKMTSYHEREREDLYTITCNGFGMRVPINHKKVVATGRGNVDDVASYLAVVGHERHAGK